MSAGLVRRGSGGLVSGMLLSLLLALGACSERDGSVPAGQGEPAPDAEPVTVPILPPEPKPQAPLNLKLPEGDEAVESEGDWSAAQAAPLPDMFKSGSDGGGRVSVGGRVYLREEQAGGEQPDFAEAVDGGEIEIRMKTR